MSIGANCSDGHAHFDPQCPACVEVATIAAVEFAGALRTHMAEEMPRQAMKHGAAVAALRLAFDAYQTWQDGMTNTDDFLDWAAEEVIAFYAPGTGVLGDEGTDDTVSDETP